MALFPAARGVADRWRSLVMFCRRVCLVDHVHGGLSSGTATCASGRRHHRLIGGRRSENRGRAGRDPGRSSFSGTANRGKLGIETEQPGSAREANGTMPDYQLEGPKPARMYEVILPKKIGYFGKVQEVLEDLFDEEAIRAIPFVKRSIARHRRVADFDEDAWVKNLCRASRGYSIYEMDGRYLSPSGPIDERVLVIRFIFHNPEEGAGETPGGKGPRTDFLETSLEVVNHLVALRFAEELGVEEEIWFLEYNNPRLAIWRKGAGAGNGNGGPEGSIANP
jgi:hypothetical protein